MKTQPQSKLTLAIVRLGPVPVAEFSLMKGWPCSILPLAQNYLITLLKGINLTLGAHARCFAKKSRVRLQARAAAAGS